MTARKRLRAALIGTGGIADVHLIAFRARETDIDLVVAVDIDEARGGTFAREAGVTPATASLYKSAFTGRTVRHGEITSGDPFYRSMDGRIREGVTT
ncbi:Gfo/Idh/MocA family oxidoreductase [Amycolatopsis sp. NPDC059657]|uniref:Gfo/Idh/MocA family oxidoreductase n=1 Tax=Amycolatopsis sp. NPDC059657 TaxID=3346899 RepID=UPI00366E3355